MDLLWPGLLLLLVLVPALVGAYLWILRRRPRPALRYSSLSLVRAAEPGSSRVRRHLPFALFAIAAAILVFGMSRPVAVVAVPSGQTTIVLAIDVSGSMCATDIPPTRLEAAEAAAARFIQSQGPNTLIGIVAFGGFAEIIQSPTNDRELLLDAIKSLTTGRRTAVGTGLLKAIDAIAEVDPNVPPSRTDSSSGPPPVPVLPGAYVPDIIVLLTDGASNTGPAPVEAAQQAVDRGIRVYTIGFGTAQGGAFGGVCAQQFLGREPFLFPGMGGGGFGGGGGGFGGGGGGTQPGGGLRRGIDEATLKRVAEVTGGQYYPAESAGELQAVFDKLPTYLIMKHEVTELSALFMGLGALLVAVSLALARAWRPLP
jgi:Ca-activated chloride channel family protein